MKERGTDEYASIIDISNSSWYFKKNSDGFIKNLQLLPKTEDSKVVFMEHPGYYGPQALEESGFDNWVYCFTHPNMWMKINHAFRNNSNFDRVEVKPLSEGSYGLFLE